MNYSYSEVGTRGAGGGGGGHWPPYDSAGGAWPPPNNQAPCYTIYYTISCVYSGFVDFIYRLDTEAKGSTIFRIE